MTAPQLVAESQDPSFVAVHPDGKYLYAVNEAGKNSMVSAFAIDEASGKLALLNQLSALGEDPCYISFDRSGKFVLIANYSSGNVAVFPILADGKLGEHTAVVQDSGALGPNKERQDAPHAHWIEPSAHNRFVYVADLGLDRVLIYKFDAAKGTLLLGVRAVIAKSFERIHRSNLVGMGVLPLEFADGANASSLGLTGRELYDFEGLAHLRPRQTLTVRARGEGGAEKSFRATVRIDTPRELDYYRHGGILPYVLRQLI
jgi:hypothetical protein